MLLSLTSGNFLTFGITFSIENNFNFFSVFVSLGILITTLLGYYLPWKTVAICCGLIAATSFALIMFIPESPSWLVGFRSNKKDEAPSNSIKRAEISLKWLYKRKEVSYLFLQKRGEQGQSASSCSPPPLNSKKCDCKDSLLSDATFQLLDMGTLGKR